MSWIGWDEDFDDSPMVCTSHVRFVPCRKGHEGDEWGVGCEFSTDPLAVALVDAYHRGWITE